MVTKHLVKHGNSQAIVIDGALLKAAGIDEHTLFQITATSNGLVIQSVQPTNEKLIDKTYKMLLKKHHAMLKRLADK